MNVGTYVTAYDQVGSTENPDTQDVVQIKIYELFSNFHLVILTSVWLWMTEAMRKKAGKQEEHKRECWSWTKTDAVIPDRNVIVDQYISST